MLARACARGWQVARDGSGPGRTAVGLLTAAFTLAGCVALGAPSGPGQPSPTLPATEVQSTSAATTAPVAPRPEPSATPRVTHERIARFTGRGRRESKAFRVDASWSILWSVRGAGLVEIRLVPTDRDSFGELLLEAIGPLRGKRTMLQAGRYRLVVEARGPWTIDVLDLEALAPAELPVRLAGAGWGGTTLLRAPDAWWLSWSTADTATTIRAVTRSGASFDLVSRGDGRYGCRRVALAGELTLVVESAGAWSAEARPDGDEAQCMTVTTPP